MTISVSSETFLVSLQLMRVDVAGDSGMFVALSLLVLELLSTSPLL